MSLMNHSVQFGTDIVFKLSNTVYLNAGPFIDCFNSVFCPDIDDFSMNKQRGEREDTRIVNYALVRATMWRPHSANLVQAVPR
jgi:hypothetical protein